MRRFAALALATIGLGSVGLDARAGRGFTPVDGRYQGEYTSGNHGPGEVRLKVGPLRPGLHGVKLLEWSGTLHCEGEPAQPVDVGMTAARSGRAFSGFVTYNSPPGKDRFTGRFTATDAVRGTVRVIRGEGEGRCDTGPIRFTAKRVVP